MAFIFRPLDAEAIALRKFAQRLADKLPGRRGTIHTIQDGYILRAVGDGKTVVVTAIPPTIFLGGAYMGWEKTGNYYPNSSTHEQLSIGFMTITHGKLKGAALSGAATDGGVGKAPDFRRYSASGRVTVGNVTQQWPLVDYSANVSDGWIRSLPDYLIEGQSRYGPRGAIGDPAWATAPLVQETALLTLLTPTYRGEHYTATSNIATAAEAAITLLRCCAQTKHIKLTEVLPDYPAAIKTDLQADPTERQAGLGGVGLIEFGCDALGIEVAPLINDLDPSAYAGNLSLNEGFVEPLGAVEWNAANGIIAVRALSRGWDQRLIFLRYQLTQTDGGIVGAALWRREIAGRLRNQPDTGMAQQNTGGMWSTRSGRGMSDGSPEQPDVLIALSVDFGSSDGGLWITRLYTLDVVTGAVSTNELDSFDCEQSNSAGPLLRSDYFFAKGITLGTGEDARPALVCVKRTVPYHLATAMDSSTVRVPVGQNRSHADDVSVVTIKHTGAIVTMDIGPNFIATYKPGSDYRNTAYYDGAVVDGKYRLLGFQYLRGGSVTSGAAQYGHPICEFAPGYIAMLVTPSAAFTAAGWPSRIVICNASTGFKVYESADIPLPAMIDGTYRGISCAQQGTVSIIDGVETIASKGALLLSFTFSLVNGVRNPGTGCYSTLDLGVTLARVLGNELPAGVGMHYLGSPLKPARIGVSP